MSIANELASTLQSAHLNRAPDPAYDANPSTAASSKTPVSVAGDPAQESEDDTSHSQDQDQGKSVHLTTSAAEAETETFASSQQRDGFQRRDEREIPLSILRPLPRQPSRPTANVPPLPDLRFEQSYLARIAPYTGTPTTTSSTTNFPSGGASQKPNYTMIAYITLLDHVLMPLSQGIVWNLAVFGWRRWNTGVRFQGHGVGARVRRWWWGVNGWSLPEGTG